MKASQRSKALQLHVKASHRTKALQLLEDFPHRKAHDTSCVHADIQVIAGRLFEVSFHWWRGASTEMSGSRSVAARPPVCFHPYSSDPLRLMRLLADVQQRTSRPFHQTSNFECDVSSKPRTPDIDSSDRFRGDMSLQDLSR